MHRMPGAKPTRQGVFVPGSQRMKFGFFAKRLAGVLIAAGAGAFSLTQIHVIDQNASVLGAGRDGRQLAPAARVDLAAKLALEHSIVADAAPVSPAVDRPRLGLPAGSAAGGQTEPIALSTPGP